MGMQSSGFSLLKCLMEKAPNELFVFEVPAGMAQTYVNRIRVELSGLRKMMRGMGKKPKMFKVIISSVRAKILEDGTEDPLVHIVSLMRTDGQVVIAQGMQEMIDMMEQEGRKI